MSQTRRLAAILAADVAGYSRLMGADEGDNGRREILFKIETGAGRGSSIGTSFDGIEYHIDIDPSGHRDRSAQVLGLVMELLALNTAAKELPAPSVITR